MKNKKNIFLLICLMFFSTACGSDTYPEPDMSNEFFVWYNLKALPHGQCFSVTGNVEGKIKNIKSIALEVEELTEACIGCPFMAQESELFLVNEVLDRKNGTFSLNYCPLTPATAFRWRVVGHNIINGVSNLYSVPMELDMKIIKE